MIRTGYLRWEIEVDDVKNAVDLTSRDVLFLARPSYRFVRVKSQGLQDAAQQFLSGEDTYDEVLRSLNRRTTEVDVEIPNIGPRVFRYSESDRNTKPRYWMDKLNREVNAFAHDVVREAAKFPQLVISNAALRAGYARMVETEIIRVIEGKSQPRPTIETERMLLDASAYGSGVPELVAAELVRDVVEPKEFDEFCRFDRVTVESGGKLYRIPRQPHGMIEVWDARTQKPEVRLCVIFEDAGMPPSDEVVMKYLLAKHQPDLLWQIGIKFSKPTGRFDGGPPRRWRVD